MLTELFPELEVIKLSKSISKQRELISAHDPPLAVCRFDACLHLPPREMQPAMREIYNDQNGFKVRSQLIGFLIHELVFNCLRCCTYSI